MQSWYACTKIIVRDTVMSPDEKFAKVMSEFHAGTLRSASGQPVTSKRQAMAIALSEAGMKQ